MRTNNCAFSRLLVAALLILLSTYCRAEGSERTYYATYKLYGQTRKFELYFSEQPGGQQLRWRMERHGHWREGTYLMSDAAIKSADCMNYSQPTDGSRHTLKDNELFMMLSNDCFDNKSGFKLNGLLFEHSGDGGAETEVFVNRKSGCTIEALKEKDFHLIMRMENNPMKINWTVKKWAPESASLTSELKADPRKTAGTYRAYPWTSELAEGEKSIGWSDKQPPSLFPTPEGFTAIYISHYGRHGSRWMPDAKRYTTLIEFFDSIKKVQPLTDKGEKVYALLWQAWQDAKGREGSLSSLGAAQHKGIAKRMVERFPSVFNGSARVEARSSTVMRCAMSMAAFCDGLKGSNPYLRISTESNERTMEVINNVTPEAKAMSKDPSWYADYQEYTKNAIDGDRLCRSLFGENGLTKEEKAAVLTELYWYASDMQDVTIGADLYDYLTDEELYNMWTTVNYRMFVCNSWCPLGKGTGPDCAKGLLADIVKKADECIYGEKAPRVAADLRFGHDTALLRILALMGIEGCTSREANPKKFAEAWQDFRISPMAANLQMVFYKDSKGEVIVKLLLNEGETRIDGLSPDISPCYYKWERMKQKMLHLR